MTCGMPCLIWVMRRLRQVPFDDKGIDCHLELLTGSPVVEAMEKHFIPWLAECGVSNLRYSLAGDEDG